jgi:M6 family metalloprotease-like protein
LSKNRKSYGGNDSQGYDKGVGAMVGEACTLLNDSVDFSQYDNDGDGVCDVVIVLYAGDGEASSYESDAANAVWPCQWELSSSDYGKSLTLDKVTIDKFAVFNELNGSDLSKIDGIGTFCHEFSHCLDLPDFYDTNYGNHFGMGHWSLLDYGCYNNDGYTPVGYSAYEKAFMGWIDIEEAKENTLYTLPVFNQKDIATDKAVKLTNSKDSKEYYILENRANQGWDKYMPAEGLMITHVTYSASVWEANTVNNDLQRMTVIPADNSLKMTKENGNYYIDESSLKGDLWPYGGANELTDTSTPAAKVNTGSYMGKPITSITKNSDGTVSFWAMKSALPAVDAPANLSAEVLSSTSATLNWDAVADADITYSVEVSEHKDVTYSLVSSTDFSNHNWTEDGSINKDTAGDMYLGSNKKTGSVTSPSFSTDDEGIVTVIFNAKYYGSDKSSVKVSLFNGSSEVASETIELSDTFDTYTVVFNGPANATAKVKFETVANKKRVYLTTADIYLGDASEVSAKAPARAASTTLTFSGVTENSLTVSDLQENGSYDFRVKAVPVDATSFTESAWSAKSTFTLAETSSVAAVEVSNNGATEYFNLQGVRINGTPTAAGIYIRRQGGKTSKVLVK